MPTLKDAMVFAEIADWCDQEVARLEAEHGANAWLEKQTMAHVAEYCRAQSTLRDAAPEAPLPGQSAEERYREALHTIFCNTEPDAIKHRDYEHLAADICACAKAALDG